VIKAEVGKNVRETDDLVVSVLRGHRLLGYDDPAASPLQLTDRVITIVRASPLHTSPMNHSQQPNQRP
jgi:voltage-gated potassium channel